MGYQDNAHQFADSVMQMILEMSTQKSEVKATSASGLGYLDEHVEA